MADQRPMPPVPAEIEPYVRALGVERTVALILEMGGAPLYFAGRASCRSRVAGIIGEEGVEALGRAIGGSARRVPLVKPWMAQYLAAQGMSGQEIARTLHITDVTTRKYLKGAKSSPQLDFFRSLSDGAAPRA